MASLIPTWISHALAGQAVKNPAIIPICIKNQYTGLQVVRGRHIYLAQAAGALGLALIFVLVRWLMLTVITFLWSPGTPPPGQPRSPA